LGANDFYLNMSGSNVNVTPTERTKVYSLLETESLKEDWVKTTEQRGNGSNLVFDANTSATSKFFKATSEYEPLDPIEKYVWYAPSPGDQYPVNYDFNVVNYETNSIPATITWTETFNPYGNYTNNLPYDMILNPGTNAIIAWIKATPFQTGMRVEGMVNVERDEVKQASLEILTEDLSNKLKKEGK